MKNNYSLLYLCFFVVVASLTACHSEKSADSKEGIETEQSSQAENTVSNNATNMMVQDTLRKYKHNPWAGSFYGILPCEDCEGTEILITLEFDGVAHYSTREYASDDNGETGVGRAQWDETGKIVSVKDYYGVPHKFLYDYDQDVLYKLDKNGKKYSGPQAASYTLIRSDN